jgi:crotonobetainyl-CoA:carnitine CoA-transferase CaiB-like acyl-CoA transferase
VFGDHFPLDDLLVVEAGEAITPAYASKLLAELGATVIRIDPPCGGRLRGKGTKGTGHLSRGNSLILLNSVFYFSDMGLWTE